MGLNVIAENAGEDYLDDINAGWIRKGLRVGIADRQIFLTERLRGRCKILFSIPWFCCSELNPW